MMKVILLLILFFNLIDEFTNKAKIFNYFALSIGENESEVYCTQKSMDSFVDKSISTNEAAAIHRQLLRALISANVSFSFVENPEVNKLFKMLRPSYDLPSRKWISTEVLDQVHEEVELEIKKFATEAKFLTLSGDGWTNVSKQRQYKSKSQ
jgi:hypothetical protein